MVTPLELPQLPRPIFGDETRIPADLAPRTRVFEITTVADAKRALTRLRELRRDFDAHAKRKRAGSRISGSTSGITTTVPGEERLAGLSNIQRMRTIRQEIAALEELMVRLAAREFELEEQWHITYLTSIGQWAERRGSLSN